MKPIIHQFDPVIYPRKLWIVVTRNIQCVKDRFFDNKLKSEIVYEDISKFHATTCSVMEKRTLLYGVIITFSGKDKMNMGNIAHEATHAARIIWDELGETSIGMEADAYLVGWIAECCEKVKLNKF
jgi:hypothetical protein